MSTLPSDREPHQERCQERDQLELFASHVRHQDGRSVGRPRIRAQSDNHASERRQKRDQLELFPSQVRHQDGRTVGQRRNRGEAAGSHATQLRALRARCTPQAAAARDAADDRDAARAPDVSHAQLARQLWQQVLWHLGTGVDQGDQGRMPFSAGSGLSGTWE